MRILAIDPSTKSLGWALLDDERVLACGLINVYAQANIKSGKTYPMPYRLGAVAVAVDAMATSLLFTADPEVVAVEQGFERGLGSRVLSTIRDGIYRAAYDGGVTSFEIPPSTWRASIFPKDTFRDRSGAALKQAAIDLASEIAGHLITSDDVAEAICIGLYVSRNVSRPKALAA